MSTLRRDASSPVRTRTIRPTHRCVRRKPAASRAGPKTTSRGTSKNRGEAASRRMPGPTTVALSWNGHLPAGGLARVYLRRRMLAPTRLRSGGTEIRKRVAEAGAAARLLLIKDRARSSRSCSVAPRSIPPLSTSSSGSRPRPPSSTRSSAPQLRPASTGSARSSTTRRSVRFSPPTPSWKTSRASTG